MALSFTTATPDDAVTIAAVRNAAGEALTRRFGKGHWSSLTTEESVRREIGTPHHLMRVIVARERKRVAGVLSLQTKKPWAIDVAYFIAVKKSLYLTNMAVAPRQQGKGVGKALLEEASRVARAWPAHAIRLDAYDTDAGAGGFYAACGYREVGRVVYRKTPLVYYELVV